MGTININKIDYFTLKGFKQRYSWRSMVRKAKRHAWGADISENEVGKDKSEFL